MKKLFFAAQILLLPLNLLASLDASNFRLSYEGVNSNDLNLEFSAQQIDVIASGSSPWGIVNALWVTDSGDTNSLSWDNDWTISVIMRNSVTVADGGTYTDSDGDVEAVNQAVIWMQLLTTAAGIGDDSDILEIKLQDHNGVKRIVVDSEFANDDYSIPYSPSQEAHIRLSYDSITAEITSAYSYNGSSYTDLRTSSVASLASYLNGYPIGVSLGAESDYVAINAGQNYFKGFTVTGAPTWELYDNFSGATMDTQKWETWYMLGGLEPTVTAGELKLEIVPGNIGVKDVGIVELQASFNQGTDNSGVTFTDPSIIGVEVDLRLPVDVAMESGVFIGSVSSSLSNVKFAGIELANRSTGPEFDIDIGEINKGSQPASLDQSYRLRLSHINGKVQIFIDGSLVLDESVPGEFLGMIIGAFNDAGQSMYATVDNVSVLRSSAPPTPSLPVVESYGNTVLLEDSSGYYAGSASTPLIYNGNQLGPIAGYSALGVDLHNGQYRLVIFNGIQYLVNYFNTSGVSQGIFSAVSDMSAEEIKLSQDLDGDGHVGALPIAPPASIAEMQFEFSIGNGIIASAPFQEFYGSDGVMNLGFSNSIFERVPYTYNDGVISFPQLEKELRLTFAGADSGTFDYYDVYDLINEQLEYSGNFAVVTPSLETKTGWQRTESFNSALSTTYWNVIRREVDSLVYDDGELNFIFGSPNSPIDTEINYARTLPMNEDWQVVIDDMYATPALNDFKIEVDIEIASPEFELEIFYEDNGGGRRFGAHVGQYTPSGWQSAGASVTSIEDERVSSGGNIRVAHIASTRELIFEYQPEGANDWSELANFNLTTGAFQGQHNSYGSNFTGGLVNAISDRMSVDIEAYASFATQVGDLEIGGIEIGTYTLPTPLVDTDGDGLYDSVETNTGIYVSPSDTGTDPQLEDSTGDGFTDGEVVSAGLSPVIDYSSLLEIVRNNSERFGLENTSSTVDMNMSSLRLERTGIGAFNMNFDLEMSTDLQTWTPHTSHSIELSVPDQSKTFMRLNVK